MSSPIKRELPSTKARQVSYLRMRQLFDVLEKMGITHPYSKYYDDDTDDSAVDYKGWKGWTNKHTPPDKRGGPSNHTKRSNR